MKTFKELIEAISQTTKTKEKEHLVDQFINEAPASEIDFLQGYFYYWNLGIKYNKVQGAIQKAKVTIFKPQTPMDVSNWIELFNKYRDRKFNDYSEYEFLKWVGRAILHSSETNKFGLSTILYQAPIGIGVQTMNKCWQKKHGKNFITPFGIMKAFKFNADRFKEYGLISVEEKYDGLRCVVSFDHGNLTIRSSSGKEFQCFPKAIKDELNAIYDKLFHQFNLHSWCLDSELISTLEDHTKGRQLIAGLGNKMLKNEFLSDDDEITLKDFGQIRVFNFFETSAPEEISLIESREKLDVYISNDNTYIKPAKYELFENVNFDESIEKVMNIYADYLSKSCEGVIVKNLNANYEIKRSWNWMKLKEERTADVRIIGTCEGHNSKTGTLGGFIVEITHEDKLIRANVGSGLSDAQREEYWNRRDEMIGKICEIKFNDIIQAKNSDTYSFFLPIFKCIREDKTDTNID